MKQKKARKNFIFFFFFLLFYLFILSFQVTVVELSNLLIHVCIHTYLWHCLKSSDLSPRRSPRAQSLRALQSPLVFSKASAFSAHSAVKLRGIEISLENSTVPLQPKKNTKDIHIYAITKVIV